MATAIAIPTPICFTGITSVKANAPVITIMISAADVIIRLVDVKPSIVARVLSEPFKYSSWIREIKRLRSPYLSQIQDKNNNWND